MTTTIQASAFYEDESDEVEIDFERSDYKGDMSDDEYLESGDLDID